MGVNSRAKSISTLLHPTVWSFGLHVHFCVCVCVCGGKGDVMFDDIIADVQGVQISGRGSLEPALHSCPALSCVPPEPFIPPCQLCQTVSSRNSLKLTLISSASLPIPAQIERGKTLPPTFQSHYHQPFGRPHRPSHFAKAELQASYAQCFFCLSPSMSPSFKAAPSPCSGQVGDTSNSPPPLTPHPQSQQQRW